MAPQHQNDSNKTDTKPVAIKNALNQEIKHYKFDHSELLSVY
ncbi:hypothetical protein PC123_g25246, partial [Phytophthora cactorum]